MRSYIYDPQEVYSESEKYSDWELGDLYRTLARIEMAARREWSRAGIVDPEWLLTELGIDQPDMGNR